MLFHLSYVVMKLKERKFVHLHFYNHRLEWWQIPFFFELKYKMYSYVMLKAREYLALCI